MHPVLCSHVKDPIKHEFIKLLHFQDLISSPLLTLDWPQLTSSLKICLAMDMEKAKSASNR